MGIIDSMYIGANALKAHGTRLDIHAKNVANVDTPNYVRKIPILNSQADGSAFASILSSMSQNAFVSGNGVLQGGVNFTGVVEDPNLGEKIYKPGHPDADENGFIRASNVNAMVDIADAMLAQRAYEANLAVLNISKAMALKAADIGK